MAIFAVLLGFLAVLSFALNLWQVLIAGRFPLHQRVAASDFAPPITVLKPLKGCDAETEVCLRSWLTQTYKGPVQMIFGAASSSDPVCALVERLLAEHPGSDARLIVCPEALGANAKVSTMAQLQSHVRHDLVLVSDADVWVPNDFLSNVVQPLRSAEAGLVNCFYQIAAAGTLAMRWEAVAVNTDFWSQVLQSRSLKLFDFALGAVMLIRRAELEAIGGFGALVNHLADDYELGHRIAARGRRVELCPVVVECREAPMSLGQVIGHQLRWSRTIRFCEPLAYFFSVLGNATLWPVLWCLAARTNLALGLAGTFLCWRAGAAFWLEKKFTRQSPPWWQFWLPWGKDLAGALIWLLAFLGNRIEWRGETFRVKRGGQLVRL